MRRHPAGARGAAGPPGAGRHPVLLIAVGNPLRRDDGAAACVLETLGAIAGVKARQVMQLAPELAADFEGKRLAVILDADAAGEEVRLDPLPPDEAPAPPLGHAVSPAEVLRLAHRLFGFSGDCYLCRIPGFDFAHGEGLSAGCAAMVVEASRQVRALVERALAGQKSGR